MIIANALNLKGIFNYIRKAFASIGLAERFLLFLLLVVCVRPLLDPDFGWHLRSGTDLLKNLSVPKFDPYSYTLPDYHWVNFEWLTDGVVAFVYQNWGALSLSILFALLIGGAFLLAASLEKTALKYKILAALVAILASLPILGVRMQMVTLLGMALILWILYRWRRGEIKTIWWLPIIFLVWTNLHAGFATGLLIMAVFFVVELIKYLALLWWPKIYKRLHIAEAALSANQLKSLLWVGLASGAATLVNPYGWGLHYDFYKFMTNPFAIPNIAEWQPVVFSHPISYNFIIYIVLFATVLLLAYRKIEPTRWVVTGLFLVLSLMYWRNMPFFMLMSTGFLAEMIQEHTHLVFDKLLKKRWILLTLVVIVSILAAQRISDVGSGAGGPTKRLGEAGYPIAAINWAKANPDKIGAHMLNEYGWGGLIIWQFPEQRVFIDGRMPHWQVDNRFVFYDEEYFISAHPGAVEAMEKKYGIDWVFIQPDRPLALVLSGRDDWEKVYGDGVAVIYRKVPPSNVE
ncbi:hypothetical protein A2V68_00055 [candidate division Kazan bacterium RBG_13_50_9]|uniref:Glycosyltransferase RgtA/B/C/D-like domain-containing protein n=1 Tax=candidate division Kazan bacterium RBG_13_50_9 TaxID=1798535 RepID=A0A1F4NRK4_UNCK3|nr:MAG: hypothetical protein A2V68_00055 [candidate division Kazan bacterium RBG_13_50_9]